MEHFCRFVMLHLCTLVDSCVLLLSIFVPQPEIVSGCPKIKFLYLNLGLKICWLLNKF